MNYSLQELQDLLPEFIEEVYPKWKNLDRGTATLAITLFTLWLRNREGRELKAK